MSKGVNYIVKLNTNVIVKTLKSFKWCATCGKRLRPVIGKIVKTEEGEFCSKECSEYETI